MVNQNEMEDLLRIKELFCRMHQGDSTARDLLVKGNLGLVVVIVENKFRSLLSHIPCEFSDLVQYGSLGLVKAVDKYDPNKGRFSTYASLMIKWEIIAGIRELIPRQVWEIWNKAQKAENRLKQEFERVPTTEEIAEDLDMTAQEIEKNLNAFSLLFPESLEYLNEKGIEVEMSEEEISQSEIEDALRKLNRVELKIIIAFHINQKLIKEIAQELDKTDGYVKGTKSRAEEKLRQHLEGGEHYGK